MALKDIAKKATVALKKASRDGKGSPMASKTHGPGHGSDGHGLEEKAVRSAKKAVKKKL